MNALALVTDAFGGHGGIAQYNRDLMTALAACPGMHRIVVVPRHGRSDGALPPGVRQLKARGNRIVYSLSALDAAATLGPFDFVYCGHLHLSPLAAVIAWFLGIPLWLQLYGWEAWEKPSRSELRAAERARLVTAISRHTRRRFLSLTGVDPTRLQVLPTTVDPCFSPGAKPDRLLDRYGLRGKRILLTVGRLDPDERRKGHDKVIQALPEASKTFPDLVYLVVGQGEDRARLQALARSLGVEKTVFFTGGVAPDELPQLYRIADLFVMPSTQEGFGIVFLEAAASGIPIIGGNVDGSTDALADGALGIAIDPANTGALVQAIKQGLQGHAPDPAAVRRFKFENFAGRVGDLVSGYLRPAADAQVK
jgi:phosphatidylinositol alpha-1,6-mannosyltransferase